MDEKVSKTLSERAQFLDRLEADLEKAEQFENEVKKNLEELDATAKNIKELGQQPEHVALIPLAKRIYMEGRIVHTGEYYVEMKAYPEPYSVLQTLDQTIKFLEDKIATQKDSLKKIETTKEQLKERMNLVTGIGSLKLDDSEEVIESEVTEDMPQQIETDKGVAVKVGGFYEIIEFED